MSNCFDHLGAVGTRFSGSRPITALGLDARHADVIDAIEVVPHGLLIAVEELEIIVHGSGVLYVAFRRAGAEVPRRKIALTLTDEVPPATVIGDAVDGVVRAIIAKELSAALAVWERTPASQSHRARLDVRPLLASGETATLACGLHLRGDMSLIRRFLS